MKKREPILCNNCQSDEMVWSESADGFALHANQIKVHCPACGVSGPYKDDRDTAMSSFRKIIACDPETATERDRLKTENAALKELGDELLKVAEMVIDISDKPPKLFSVRDTMSMIRTAADAIADWKGKDNE